MTDFKDEPVAGVDTACRHLLPIAQPGTLLAAIAALESQGDFTRAKTVRNLLEAQA